MKITLKPLRQQCFVITGASSGIGLATARLAAKRGASVVLASRSDEALARLEHEIREKGGKAIHVEADVGKEGDVERIATVAESEFGGIDTWVNNAGVSIYGKVDEVPIEDFRRVFETNFWGVVYGSLSAMRHMKSRGGAIINLGSVVSDTSVPLQVMYSASKHAVKAFTDGLRMEVASDKLPISVTLIKPSAIDTPYIHHAKNYLDRQPTNPAPWYAPELVARAIIRCAEKPRAEITIGGAGQIMSLGGRYAPRLRDRIFTSTMISGQKSDKTASADEQSGLSHPTNDLRERSGESKFTLESSLYTQAVTHPILSSLALVGGGVAVFSLLRGSGNGSSRENAF